MRFSNGCVYRFSGRVFYDVWCFMNQIDPNNSFRLSNSKILCIIDCVKMGVVLMKYSPYPIILIFILFIAGATVFQNCAEVQYLRSPSSDVHKTLGHEGNPRTVLLTPVFKDKDPVSPVKVLLVIDNSKSMLLNNLKLKESIHTLLEPLKHVPVQLKIITTDALTQDKVALESQGWSVAISNLGPKVSASDYLKKKFKIQPHEVFSSGYDVFYYLNRADLYNFLADDPDFASKIEVIRNRIVQISSSGKGSNREQALCNTLLALYDQGPNRLFHPGDRAAIVILTDEDDGSRWHTMDTAEWRRDCRNRYTYGSIGDTSKPHVQNADYQMNTWNIKFEIAYEKLNDGIVEAKTAGDNGGLPVSPSKFPELKNADASVKLECGNEELISAQNYAKYLVGSALIQNIQIKNCRIIPSWTALYGFGKPSEDRCTSLFSVQKSGPVVNYQGMADYYERDRNAILVKGSCQRRVSSGMSHRGFSDFYIDGALDPVILETDRLPVGHHIPSMQKAILNRAKELFGAKRFYISSIIHKTNQCVQGTSQSIGAAFMNLASRSPDVADRIITNSICEADYKNSFSGLSQLIAKEFVPDMVLNQILVDEEIESVVIRRGEEVFPLVLNEDYRLEPLANSKDLKLIFVTQKIELGDVVEVLLVKK